MSHSIVDAPKQTPPRHPAEPSANNHQVSTAEPEKDKKTEQRGPLRRGLSAVLSSIGPTLVLIGFAAVFYYGHHNDWRIPKFAALTGSVETVADDLV